MMTLTVDFRKRLLLDAAAAGRERRESGFSDSAAAADVVPSGEVPSSSRSAAAAAAADAVVSRRESYDSGLSVTPPTLAAAAAAELAVFAEGRAAAAEEPEVKAVATKVNKKRRRRPCESLSSANFRDLYRLTGELLGEGSYGRVLGCRSVLTGKECAVKVVSKAVRGFSRSKMLKEVGVYHLCRGCPEIVQLIEYFEEESDDNFYLVFEKVAGGPLLDVVQRRGRLPEPEAAAVVRDLAAALAFLHSRGIAHRDLKPENVLYCGGDLDGDSGNGGGPVVKLCDFDLCSAIHETVSTPMLQSPVGSVEYMAPEVVNAFAGSSYSNSSDLRRLDQEMSLSLTYDKRCDLWSLGVMAYVLLCGYMPFSSNGSGRGSGGPSCGCRDFQDQEDCPVCQERLFRAIRSGRLRFPDHPWTGLVSDDAKDLVSRLLVLDASSRLSASQVLQHPWILWGQGQGRSAAPEPAGRAPRNPGKVTDDFDDDGCHLEGCFANFPLLIDHHHHHHHQEVNLDDDFDEDPDHRGSYALDYGGGRRRKVVPEELDHKETLLFLPPMISAPATSMPIDMVKKRLV